MMRTEPRTLKQMHRYPTAYEVVAELPGGRTLRLGFLVRVNKLALLKLAHEHADALLPHVPEDAEATYTADGGWQFGPVRVRKSGRTERDVAVEEGAQ